MPVRKDAAALLAAGARDTALTDAACLVFMGTTVISGSALAVVIATGRSALFGGLSRAFQWQRPRTRFERGMNSTSWMLMAFTAVTVPVSMLVTGIASGDWLQALLFGVSVAVGLTPEMLPLIVTVCLSRGARTMAPARPSSGGSTPSRRWAAWTCCASTRPAHLPAASSSSTGRRA